MKDHRIISIRSTSPPVVEIDTESQNAYVRFSNNRVAKTVAQNEKSGPVIVIDFDAQQEVVGVELLGVQEFGIKMLLVHAQITVPPQLLDMVRCSACSYW